MRNLHQIFFICTASQIIGGDFAKFCGLLRIYELYQRNPGNVVGGIVGEKLGEKGATKFGIDEAAGKMSNDLAKVVGQRNVDKMGEIAQTALGYSAEEECVCCSCMPASQILFFIMSG